MKPSYIYRLVTDNSMEKKIYDRQVSKQGMSSKFLVTFSLCVKGRLLMGNDLVLAWIYIKNDGSSMSYYRIRSSLVIVYEIHLSQVYIYSVL